VSRLIKNGISHFSILNFKLPETGSLPQTIQAEISKNIVTGIALTVFMFAIAVYIPVIGFFCSLFTPLPILFYRSKLGRKIGVFVAGTSVAIMILLLGRISFDILFFAELLLTGFVLSELIEMNLSLEKTVLYACAAVLFVGIAGLIFYSNVSRKEIVPLISEYIADSLRLTMKLYENAGMSEESVRMISDSLQSLQYVMVRITPGMAISFTLFVIWTTLLLAKPLLKSRGLFYPDFGRLRLWKVPEQLVWAAIGCGVVLLFPDKSLKLLAVNGLIILMTLYFFGGIAIVSFYFEKKRFPVIIRVMLYSLIAFQQVVLIAVIGLGFFDMWLNFRKAGADK